MTTVNWERQPGETVEELAAALLLQGAPRGNQITASRGDRGIDIRIRGEAGWDIYQVKRYCRPLTPKQKREIESSWTTFVTEALPTMPVVSWNLVMPWNPTLPQSAWLEEFTGDVDVNVNWIGLTQLDFLAANNPRIVDYFYGDGGARLQELMAQALAAGKELPPGLAGEQLLHAVVARQRALAIAMDEIDPFYRYEVEVRRGALAEDWLSQIQPVDDTSSFVTYEQIGDDSLLVTRLTARNPLASVLRPIAHHMLLDLSRQQHREDYERFRRYGVPFTALPAVTVSSSGPPGITVPPDVRATVSMALRQAATKLDLEIRVLAPSGTPGARLPLHDVEVTHGDVARGMRIAGWDQSHSLSIEALMSEDDVPDELSLTTTSIAGKPVTQVVEVVEFSAAIEAGSQLQLAFRGGMPIGAPWPVEESDRGNQGMWREIVADLLIVQQHTYSIVRMPETLTEDLIAAIRRAGSLLRGETVTESWTHGTATATRQNPFGAPDFALAFTQPLTLKLGDELIETDRTELTHTPHARLEDPSEPLAAGDALRIIYVQAPTTRAVSQVAVENRPE